jgi:membrane protein DedA with SNARE-associated domain
MVDASPWMSSFYELINAYGLWVLFIGITLECVGIPVPGETMLISVALYAGSTHRACRHSVVTEDVGDSVVAQLVDVARVNEGA